MALCFQVTDLQKFCLSPLLSDVTIVCGDRRLSAHKLILTMASEFFRSAFTGGFIESTSQVLVLHDDDPDAIAGMLKHIYGDDPFTGTNRVLDIYYDLRLFAVAGKYQLENLLLEAAESAGKKIERLWRHATFLQLLRTIYEEIPSHGGQIRDVVKRVCRAHLSELMQRKDFKEVILELPELALDIMDVVSREKS